MWSIAAKCIFRMRADGWSAVNAVFCFVSFGRGADRRKVVIACSSNRLSHCDWKKSLLGIAGRLPNLLCALWAAPVAWLMRQVQSTCLFFSDSAPDSKLNFLRCNARAFSAGTIDCFLAARRHINFIWRFGAEAPYGVFAICANMFAQRLRRLR